MSGLALQWWREGAAVCVGWDIEQITADTSGVHPVVTLTGGRVGIQFKISSRIAAQAIGLEAELYCAMRWRLPGGSQVIGVFSRTNSSRLE